MRVKIFVRTGLVIALALMGGLSAFAQSALSPQQLQIMIANGQENAALNDLQQVLQAHPKSGVAWYLVAEAQDALGHEAQARDALARAQTFAPGLPFAQADKVAALQAHLAAPAAQIGFHLTPGLVIGALLILFLGLRFLSHRRSLPAGYQGGYAAGFGGRPYGPFGPGGASYGPGMGGGLGSSLLGGLAAGAGFAAGERIIDGFIDPARAQGDMGGQMNDPGQISTRDDGLMGSPGWDDNSNNSGGGFDSGGGW
jgi:hypothetical protein